MNPADDASRGLSMNSYLKNQRWFTGPEFLHQPLRPSNDVDNMEFTLADNDPEVKRVKVNRTSIQNDVLLRLTSRISKWMKLKRLVATMLQWVNRKRYIDIEDLRKAETVILKLVQHTNFADEIPYR
ncbi:uncharacterized protein LOC130644974 [Hydractinia symbiolongicarpus]|uniref:uncharacterized protein LOC130644974 n=1 Tax=Hydractinia symbiolongicarpus TaxID=13093 RepID=UPI00254D2E7C|nr:uncharacterized protein LOC130644974 [Hydractinia symbiolongicarpus]